MSKQDFIEYTKEAHGMAESLSMHLGCNFYPPLPESVKKVFLDGFNQYWAGLIDIQGLEVGLGRVYKGGLDQYGFYNYLLDEDTEEL